MKDPKQSVSETLNAYLDGELDAESVVRLERRLATDRRLARHLAELRRVRTLVREAGAVLRLADNRPVRPRSSRVLPYEIAAGVLLVVGLALGLRLLAPAAAIDPFTAELPEDAQLIRPAHLEVPEPANETRAIFHIASADPRRIRATLEHVEDLLRRYGEAGKGIRIEVVANAEGLSALRADVSPAPERIAHLRKTYANVKFLACGASLARYKREHGVTPTLLPETEVASSALDQILMRLQGGWTYVRI
jgi:intracellular sulfur oxidation DsrE/DsrF family protein